MKGKRPDYSVNTVIATEGGDRWREIGVGFTSERAGTITILLDALPITGKLVLTLPRERTTGSEQS